MINKQTKTTNDKNNDLIDLKIKLKESEKEIKEIILQQNKDIFKIKNRLNTEIERCKKFSLEKLIVEFLSIIDNIERAFNILEKQKEEKYVEILKNIEYTTSLVKEILTEFKILKINNIKVPFDPNIHQAISVQYNNKILPNHIIEVMQAGYIIDNSRLLRPAMVIVSKNKKNN